MSEIIYLVMLSKIQILAYFKIALFSTADVKFMKKLTDKTCKEKETITLECKATNPHKHPHKWLLNGQPINADSPKYVRNSVLCLFCY